MVTNFENKMAAHPPRLPRATRAAGRKDRLLRVRVSQGDYLAIYRAAAGRCTDVSNFVREAALAIAENGK